MKWEVQDYKINLMYTKMVERQIQTKSTHK